MGEKKKTLDEGEVVVERVVGRRSSIAMLGAGTIAAGVVGVLAPGSASAQCSDRDPYDPVGRGRSCGGCSDADPYDPAGRGRRCGGSGCRGISDSDPYDPVGCGRRACSDRDPYDPGGAGRHC